MASKDYLEKLKDPRWQKKRLEVFERDDWACRQCWTTTETLHVHHIFYQNGKEPWDYENFALLTLCADCHESEHDAQKASAADLIVSLARRGVLPSIFNYCCALILDDTYSGEHDLTDEDLQIIFTSMRKELTEIQRKKVADGKKD